MPRLSRKCPVGLPIHVIQRGNNRQVCFAAEADFKAFAHWLHKGSLKFGVQIHAWVLMTNHVHMLLTPKAEMAVSWLSIVQSRNYLLACRRYIELNPVRAGMVTDPADYAWSSYRAQSEHAEPQ